MMKLNESSSANVNVLGEDQLGQVVGGRGHGGYRRRNYDHCYRNRRYNDCSSYDGGYESKGCDDSYESYDCDSSYDDNYDCYDRRYS
jgi:hypothetical protein